MNFGNRKTANTTENPSTLTTQIPLHVMKAKFIHNIHY